MNMNKWIEDLVTAKRKKAMPILSFPAVQALGMSVTELISDSDKQAEGMRYIARNTDAAASVSMMDLSVEAECFGSNIRFSEYEVPAVVGGIIENTEQAELLKVPEVGACRTGIYIKAIETAVKQINDRPVFAGVIGPFSLAGRLLDVSEALVYCYDEPVLVHVVLKKVTAFITEYCKAYKEAGANGVVIAEPLAGLLSPALADEFSSAYVREIVSKLQDESFVVIYHNCGGSSVKAIDSILSTRAAAFHFGNAVKMSEVLSLVPRDTVVMGNIDPAGQFKNGTAESIREETLSLLNECGSHPNFIISSGCDIPPTAGWENINAFFAAVKEYYDGILG